MFMQCLGFVQEQGWAILCSLTNKTQDMNQTAGTEVFISLLPAFTSILFCSRVIHTNSTLNSISREWHKTPPLVPKRTR
jgi:hypothetical protein